MSSARPGFCSKHQQLIKQRLHHLNLWSKVKAFDHATTVDIASAWMAGQLKREWMCPLVILMLELQAKANRLADKLGGTKGAIVSTCPCCAIVRMANDETADVKVIAGMADVVLGLFQTNGLADGEPAKSLSVKKSGADLMIGTGDLIRVRH